MLVIDLSKARELRIEKDDPEEAVREAFRQARPGEAVPELIHGLTSVACGDFAAKTRELSEAAEECRAAERRTKGEDRAGESKPDEGGDGGPKGMVQLSDAGGLRASEDGPGGA